MNVENQILTVPRRDWRISIIIFSDHSFEFRLITFPNHVLDIQRCSYANRSGHKRWNVSFPSFFLSNDRNSIVPNETALSNGYVCVSLNACWPRTRGRRCMCLSAYVYRSWYSTYVRRVFCVYWPTAVINKYIDN